MKVLITGATGTLGGALVPRLIESGHEVRAMSRAPHPRGEVGWVQADLATGDGIEEATSGVEVVVHLASAPYRGRYTTKVDLEGTRWLVSAARRAGVAHFLYISIVGVDKVPWGYFRTKLAAEALVRGGGTGWSILRATQFHQFVDNTLRGASRLPVMIGDAGIVAQPVDCRDVATRIVMRVGAGPSAAVEEIGGPEVLHFDDALRLWLDTRGVRRPMLRLRLPGRLGRALRAGCLTTTAQPVGQLTWTEYLSVTGGL